MPRCVGSLNALLLMALYSVAHAAPLDGTAELTWQGDLAERMVDGLHAFLDRETAASVERRARHWKRDFSSPEAYAKSIEPNRHHLREILGVVDERSTDFDPMKRRIASLEAGGQQVGVLYEMRWNVLPGVRGEGYLFESAEEPKTTCIVIPDATMQPEAILQLDGGRAASAVFGGLAYELMATQASLDLLVVAPINRDDTYSKVLDKQTGQSHREFIYRQAFEIGRQPIGYEVQKVLALVDEVERRNANRPREIVVLGQGDGGYVALIAAAIDTRIDKAIVAGAFAPHEQLWEEPIDRNVWRFLDEYGDAELASMVIPRPLTIHNGYYPQVPQPKRERATPGFLNPPGRGIVEREFQRAELLIGPLVKGRNLQLVGGKSALVDALGAGNRRRGKASGWPTVDPSDLPDAAARQKRQVEELVEFTQKLVRETPRKRAKLWESADRKSRDAEAWQTSVKPLRQKFYDEILGRFDQSLLPASPRTRQIYDEPKYAGYEVVLDVFPDVFAYGVLLVPKDIQPGERRPVVVCQHGLEGRPQDLTEPGSDHKAYHRYAGRLAEMGYITYSPQNPYIGKDRFRSLVRKANPLGKSLWSFIVPQHQQTVNWLASLPVVDPQRIAFYGLSYGGKTAMRVPAVVDGYCLSICSGDFNEWIWKCTSVDWPRSYMATGEYEMPEWNLGNTFNYAEMAGLIAPRPFMVERGHRDGVAPDEWVAYEYAKVRLLYADLKIPERTEIEFFDGPHTINGVGTFNFLGKHLNWPRP
jgi:cephalosporin-C deacetylase-like acetyl esterase